MSPSRALAALLLGLGLACPAAAQSTVVAVTPSASTGCAATPPAGRVVIDRLEGALAVVVSTDGAARCVRRFAIAAAAQREGAVLTDGRPDADAEASLRAGVARTRARLQAAGEGGAPW